MEMENETWTSIKIHSFIHSFMVFLFSIHAQKVKNAISFSIIHFVFQMRNAK